jgi:hypothetical protein
MTPVGSRGVKTTGTRRETKDLADKGLKLRKELFGDKPSSSA